MRAIPSAEALGYFQNHSSACLLCSTNRVSMVQTDRNVPHPFAPRESGEGHADALLSASEMFDLRQSV
jgi:hypothetical protein